MLQPLAGGLDSRRVLGKHAEDVGGQAVAVVTCKSASRVGEGNDSLTVRIPNGEVLQERLLNRDQLGVVGDVDVDANVHDARRTILDTLVREPEVQHPARRFANQLRDVVNGQPTQIDAVDDGGRASRVLHE